MPLTLSLPHNLIKICQHQYHCWLPCCSFVKYNICRWYRKQVTLLPLLRATVYQDKLWGCGKITIAHQDVAQQRFKVPEHQPVLLVVSAGKHIPDSPLAMKTRLGVRGRSRGLLWEAGAHPALGPPSGAKTIGAVFPLLLQAFPKHVWNIWKTQDAILSMIKERWCSRNTS